jgi:hypothetical protein
LNRHGLRGLRIGGARSAQCNEPEVCSQVLDLTSVFRYSMSDRAAPVPGL